MNKKIEELKNAIDLIELAFSSNDEVITVERILQKFYASGLIDYDELCLLHECYS